MLESEARIERLGEDFRARRLVAAYVPADSGDQKCGRERVANLLVADEGQVFRRDMVCQPHDSIPHVVPGDRAHDRLRGRIWVGLHVDLDESAAVRNRH